MGTPLMASGQRSGDQGPGYVVYSSHVDQCVGTNIGITICHLNRITSGTQLWKGGDSGGPLYVEFGGRYAAGMLDAVNVQNQAYYYISIPYIVAVDSVAISTSY